MVTLSVRKQSLLRQLDELRCRKHAAIQAERFTEAETLKVEEAAAAAELSALQESEAADASPISRTEFNELVQRFTALETDHAAALCRIAALESLCNERAEGLRLLQLEREEPELQRRLLCENPVPPETRSVNSTWQPINANAQGQTTWSRSSLERQALNNPLAKVYLGIFHCAGFIERSPELGVCLLREAAAAAAPLAVELVARFWAEGDTTALIHLEQCAGAAPTTGIETQLANLARLVVACAYSNMSAPQLGCPRKPAADWQRAVHYLRLAERASDVPCMAWLGRCYWFGYAVPEDEQRAVVLYTEAAKQGHAFAQNNLAYCYSNGCGVRKDKKRAAELYQQAADQGNALAQQNLAGKFESGEGVIRDLDKARELYRLSAAQGIDGALSALTRLGGSL